MTDISSREAQQVQLASPSSFDIKSVAAKFGARYGLILAWLLLIVFFAVVNGNVFLTSLTAQTIASTKAVVALLALAVLLPLVVGQFDLSVTSQFGLMQAFCAGFVVNQGMSAGLSVALVVALGAVFGLVNGLLVTVVRINAFVATLATGTIAEGIAQWYTGGKQILGAFPQAFTDAGRSHPVGIPLPFAYVVLLGAVLWVVLEYTRWGRRAFATGGSSRAALLSGINVRSITIAAFVATGAIAAFAGSVQVMILGAASPDTGGQFLLPAFAGAFLGAAVLRPGRFNVWGTIIAIYFMATGITGLQQIGAQSYIEQFFNGAALLIAVAAAQYSAARRRRASAKGTS
jgi:ribose transport system permease protein